MSVINGSTLTLYGAVGVLDEDGGGFTSKDVRDALTDHGPGDLAVNLNSAGGHAIEGLAIFNALKSHDGRVTINVDGIAASAASLILMAADEIVVRAGALIMIHDPAANAFGTADDHRKLASSLDMLSEQFRRIYAARTGRSEKKIAEMMSVETWMDADDAIKNGFADRKDGVASKAVMAFDYGIYQKSPQSLRENGNTLMSTVPSDQNEKSWAHRFYASASHSGLAINQLTEIVDASATAEIAKDSLIAKMAAAHNKGLPGPGSSAISPTGETFDNPEFLGKAIEGAIYARMSGKAPEEASREFMGRSLLDVGAILMQARGEKISWANRSSLASKIFMSGTHSTSDFPNLLTSAGNRVLLDAYKSAESPLKSIAKRKDAPDFRAIYALRLSEMPLLEKVEEGGEINYGTRAESVESFRVRTFAKIFGLTREALVNDDLGAFSQSAAEWGRAAATTEANELAALFLANSGNGVNLQDGNPIYTTGRGNKATGADSALGVASMGAARSALRKMVGLDGKTPLSITPKHLVVGPDLETAAEKLLHELSAAQVENVNPFAGKLSLHVEPRFVGSTWRLFADPSELATIVVAYLNGVTGPVVETREGWNTLGMEFRAVLDFGCGIESAKGTYLSAGA